MLCFNGWNWYLAFSGTTAIDFWQQKQRKKSGEEEQRYAKDSLCGYRDNIYLIFGTRSFFKMLLPSLRMLPLRGLEWSFESLAQDPEKAMETINET